MTKARVSASDSRFVIGIDLGTTESALSYVDLEDKNLKIKILPIPQLVDDGQIEELPSLPSVIYLKEETRNVSVPDWMNHEKIIFGNYARELGSRQPSRFVHSSKSWLCHPKVDRTSAILPWQSEVVEEKISPVNAATEFLLYLIKVWNKTIGYKKETWEFHRQKVIVTIPASFDPSARNYSLEAIEKAGIEAVMLLEEPQAAFYDYLYRNPKSMVADLKGVETVLVVDIGGGTTDFSLISINWSSDSNHPEFSRLAVGPHLLIGGDNFDMALSRQVEAAFKHKGRKLTARQWLSLTHQSRIAKEKVLAGEQQEPTTFSISGSGSKVLAGAAKIKIEAAKILDLLVDGFFPLVEAKEKPSEDQETGLSEAGLPFTRDAAITRHLAAFLHQNNAKPDAVLFNGGTMKAECLRQRLFEILTLWKGSEPRVLSNPHPTLAVSAGAAYYGMVNLGLGQRISSGNPVSIYLGIGTSKSSTGEKHVPERLMCILPKDSETEREYQMEDKSFGIDLSRDSAFYLFYTPAPPKAEKLGRIIRFNSRRYLPLPPCILKARTGKGEKQVKLWVTLRETGYLQIFCHEIEGSFSQELHFDLSDDNHEQKSSDKAPTKRRVPITAAQLKKIDKLLSDCFEGVIACNSAFKELEQIMGSGRNNWDAEMLRQLFDIFAEPVKEFNKNHETMTLWFRLLGFCLRPGYGVSGDAERVDMIWNMIDNEYDFSNIEFWSDHWVMFKRIAPGLSIERQIALKDKIEQKLFSSSRSRSNKRKISQHERNQLWRLLGHLERLPVDEKERLGWWIARSPLSYGNDMLALYALGRIGARDLAYASESSMVSQSVTNAWTDHLLRRAIPGNSYLDSALRELARKTGDRLVQIDDELRKKVLDTFKKKNRKRTFIKPLVKVAKLNESELAEFIGESLPSGFLWVKDI